MKATTTAIAGALAAFLIVACVALEDRIAKVATPQIAATAITAGCTGGRDFIDAATASLDPTAAAIIVKGVEAACALRAERKPISATIYDKPLDNFCAEIELLHPTEATNEVRAAFNSNLNTVCEARP